MIFSLLSLSTVDVTRTHVNLSQPKLYSFGLPCEGGFMFTIEGYTFMAAIFFVCIEILWQVFPVIFHF